MKSGKLSLSLVIWLMFETCIYTSIGAKNFRRDGEHNGVNFAHFVKNISHRLNGAVLVGFMVFSPIDCAYRCINNQDCYSFNFAATSLDGRHSCELLTTDMFLNSDDLVSHAGFDHYNIKVSVQLFCSFTMRQHQPLSFSLFWVIFLFVLHGLQKSKSLERKVTRR